MIGVFGKLPGAEAVKTRLRARLSEGEAERFYLASLADTLETTARVVPHPVLFLARSPRGDEHAGSTLLDAGLEPDVWRRVRLEAQSGDDLGGRLGNAFAVLLASQRELGSKGRAEMASGGGALIVGSDSPSVDAAMLVRGLEALRGADLVLGPANDGGYWAIGLHACPAGLLDDVPWSTERVLEVTQARARARGMRVALLEAWSDVDVPADLEVLARQIAGHRASGDTVTARHTERVLAALGI